MTIYVSFFFDFKILHSKVQVVNLHNRITIERDRETCCKNLSHVIAKMLLLNYFRKEEKESLDCTEDNTAKIENYCHSKRHAVLYK